ncbi:MAG: carbohydrate-binding domain-containing protein [Capnocytophaga sp.]|nr:carbohydrate-binding domain-containing protein [Capnocytophaga sp.]
MKRTFISASNFRTLFYGLASVAVLSFTACGKDDDTTDTTGTSSTTTVTNTGTTTTASGITIGEANLTSSSPLGNTHNGANSADVLSSQTFANTVTIVYNGTSATVTNNVSGVSFTQDGANIVITSTASGVNYAVSGTTTSGSLKIYSDNLFRLSLNSANITSTDRPAINIQSKQKAFVVVSGTNTLADAASYTSVTSDEDAKGAFFSEGDLIFSGSGSLSVAGSYKHGIVSDNYVRIADATITVSKATSHSIQTNDAVYIDSGTLNLTATKDGIQCEEGEIVINGGTITINAGDDGITSSYDTDTTIAANLTINGGTITINATAEGLEAKRVLTINGGTINLKTGDDAINAGEALYFNGGKTFAYATGNDAIDTNGKIGITGGIVIAVGTAAAPETSVDAVAEDSSWETGFTITGGYLVAIGTGNTPDTPLTSSTQKTVMLGGQSGSAQIINITSDSGTEALTFKAPVSYSHIMFSNSKIANGTYKIYTGGSVANGEEFNGVYTSGTYSGGTSSTQFTVNGQVTTSGASNRWR